MCNAACMPPKTANHFSPAHSKSGLAASTRLGLPFVPPPADRESLAPQVAQRADYFSSGPFRASGKPDGILYPPFTSVRDYLRGFGLLVWTPSPGAGSGRASRAPRVPRKDSVGWVIQIRRTAPKIGVPVNRTGIDPADVCCSSLTPSGAVRRLKAEGRRGEPTSFWSPGSLSWPAAALSASSLCSRGGRAGAAYRAPETSRCSLKCAPILPPRLLSILCTSSDHRAPTA